MYRTSPRTAEAPLCVIACTDTTSAVKGAFYGSLPVLMMFVAALGLVWRIEIETSGPLGLAFAGVFFVATVAFLRARFRIVLTVEPARLTVREGGAERRVSITPGATLTMYAERVSVLRPEQRYVLEVCDPDGTRARLTTSQDASLATLVRVGNDALAKHAAERAG